MSFGLVVVAEESVAASASVAIGTGLAFQRTGFAGGGGEVDVVVGESALGVGGSNGVFENALASDLLQHVAGGTRVAESSSRATSGTVAARSTLAVVNHLTIPIHHCSHNRTGSGRDAVAFTKHIVVTSGVTAFTLAT